MTTLAQFATLNTLITRSLATVVEKLPDIGETIRLAGGDGRKKLADGLLTTLLSLCEEQPPPEAAQPVPELPPDVILLTLGDREYKVHRIVEDGRKLRGSMVLERAVMKNATADEEDGKWFLLHRKELCRQIPLEHRKFSFVFAEWCDLSVSRDVRYLYFSGDRLVKGSLMIDSDWGVQCRLVEHST